MLSVVAAATEAGPSGGVREAEELAWPATARLLPVEVDDEEEGCTAPAEALAADTPRSAPAATARLSASASTASLMGPVGVKETAIVDARRDAVIASLGLC